MTRYALVRVPDGAPTPAGTFGWYHVTQPRRYAHVADRDLFTAWARDNHPSLVQDCGHTDPKAERDLLRDVAAHPGPVTIPGVAVRTDGQARLTVTPTTGEASVWESPVDLVPAGVPA